MQIIGEKIAIFNLEDASTRLRCRGERHKKSPLMLNENTVAKNHVPINPVITPLPLPKDTLMIG